MGSVTLDGAGQAFFEGEASFPHQRSVAKDPHLPGVFLSHSPSLPCELGSSRAMPEVLECVVPLLFSRVFGETAQNPFPY